MNSISKKLLTGVATLATLSMVAVNPASAETVTLQWLTETPLERYQPLIDAYQADHPEVQIEIQQVPFENLSSQIQARVGSGDSSPDIYGADTPRIPALAAQGLLLDLEEYRSEIEAAADPASIGSVTFEGKLWSFPQWNTLQLLFYNKDLLNQAGIELPSSDPNDRLTWAALLDMAATAQEGGAEWGLVFQQVDRYYQLQPLFESAGAGPGLVGEDLLTANLTTEKWVETARWYADLYESGLSPRGIVPNDMPFLFKDGKVGFYVRGNWSIADFANSGMNFGIAAIPYFEGGKPVTATGSWALGINPHSDNLETAIDFAKFLSLSAEGASLLYGTTGQMPSQNQAFESWVKEREEQAPGASVLFAHELSNTAVPRPRTIGYVAFEEVMNRMFSDIRNGADVQTALEQAEQQLNSVLGRLR